MTSQPLEGKARIMGIDLHEKRHRAGQSDPNPAAGVNRSQQGPPVWVKRRLLSRAKVRRKYYYDYRKAKTNGT